MNVRDIELEERAGSESGENRGASLDRRERLAGNDQVYESADRPQPGKPWGFWLVLAAIVVVAVMYSVTMITLSGKISPATAVGAMSAAFAVIGTLVGTYFGIKAGLDGQEKVKETMSRAVRNSEERARYRARREDE